MDNRGMLEYFLEQPALLSRLLENSEEITAEYCQYWRKNQPDRLYLIGSGTSYHAMKSISTAMEFFMGVEVTCTTPTSIPVIRGENPAVLLISQSGSSTNTIQAAKDLQKFSLAALTGERESPLHNLTDLQINLGIGRETAGPKTIGYTATVLLLLLTALYTGRGTGYLQMDHFTDAYCAVSEAIKQSEQNIRRSEDWFDRNREELVHVQKYIIVGKNSAAYVAMEGALKILETLKVPAVGYEFEEYLHGPILQTDFNLGGIYYIAEDEDQQRMESLADLHASISPFVYKVYGMNAQANDQNLSLQTTGKEYTKGIELIYPCQLIGARLPQLKTAQQSRNFFREYEAMHNIKIRASESNQTDEQKKQ